ncbi:hypothetical protein GUITHDRAFT_122218 [Guillardia theta CCMP2712]|uniref:Uncharacterized protein n=1 Tax=Guillardia theta (strain CCMP2712) TaxID=905079 RepID=L1I6T0_GUITC|nr:hypothetical protein GUITHDRAFT_122218 [Guillardia theta CCMP2712]EKX31594.1 hypothetical protein GUITHDRAFT_122218 [Guillardia theta CCMP2712]|eukprot:XP_005818574.1 hypothetical protein GUITHDRAFT_122218 [Guillardia theta CCMP2712]
MQGPAGEGLGADLAEARRGQDQGLSAGGFTEAARVTVMRLRALGSSSTTRHARQEAAADVTPAEGGDLAMADIRTLAIKKMRGFGGGIEVSSTASKASLANANANANANDDYCSCSCCIAALCCTVPAWSHIAQ